MQPVFVIKCDDFRAATRNKGSGSSYLDSQSCFPYWLQWLREMDIPSSVGIIGNGSFNKQVVNFIQETLQGNLVEYWNHGFTHKQEEFGLTARRSTGHNTAHCLKQINKTQETVKDYLGITLRAFGAPWNRHSWEISRALSCLPEIEKWFMYPDVSAYKDALTVNRALDGAPNPAKILVMNRHFCLDMSYQQFKKQFKAHFSKTLREFKRHPRVVGIALQCHPCHKMGGFRQKEAQKIISYLVDQGYRFTTPSLL